ncbi:MAG: recombination-associated protein RdgC [Desulfoplanes sp.]|jgi:DNA recombination-dependent growth factor C|nr:recombination-associated protein RdgC [Desulfoplanes sp.]
MAILSASTSLTRYHIVEDVPQELWAEVNDRLRKFAFRDIDDTADERSFGWVCFDNMLDAKWTTAPPEKGVYLTFSLRLDTRRISAAVLKKHVQLAMDHQLRLMQDQGQKFLTRDQKTEIKEQVKLRIRARTLPVPAYFNVIWDTDKNIIYLGSTTDKILELFNELFTKTFGLNLEPQTPFFSALNLLGEDRLQDLETLEPTIFV